MDQVVAVDVGGTSIKAARVDAALKIHQTASLPTPSNDPSGEQTVTLVAQLVAELSGNHSISAVGFVVPGALDEPNGVALWTGNLGWKELPIKNLLHERLQMPIAFGHDVRAAALAEQQAGAAKGAQNAVFIPVGTGIAAALIIDGAIRPSNGYAGEIGHLNVGHQLPCVCNKRGCLEAVASASAIARNYSSESGVRVDEALTVVELMRAGNPIALKVWNEAVDGLAVVCESLVTILAPELIVFGGGLAQAGKLLIDPLTERLRSSLTFQRMPAVVPAHFGANAGTIGAAVMALTLTEREGV
jgi:glucokinase